jgi:uncharacterized membrane protein
MGRRRREGGRADDGLANVLERNIEALLARRRAEERNERTKDKVARSIGQFAGSMTFVYLHLALFGGWVLVNAGLLPFPRFDPDFVRLATFASVEAIFISTFVLVMQNRMSAQADKRADLDLQVSLLAEHEITRLIRVVGAIGERLGVEESQSPDLPELERDVDPQRVLDRIERAERGHEAGPHGGP